MKVHGHLCDQRSGNLFNLLEVKYDRRTMLATRCERASVVRQVQIRLLAVKMCSRIQWRISISDDQADG